MSQEWIKPGTLCNCNGEGTDTLLIRTVDPSKQCASVAHFRHDIDLSLSQARQQWQNGFYCWESFFKLHQDFIPESFKSFNLVDEFGLKKLETVVKQKIKLVPVPCPDDALNMLLKYFGIDEEQYLDAGYGVYVGAYLAEKILKADRKLALAIGQILNHLYELGLDASLSGHESDTDKRVAMFIESLGIHAKVAAHYAQTADDWAGAVYRQDLQKAFAPR